MAVKFIWRFSKSSQTMTELLTITLQDAWPSWSCTKTWALKKTWPPGSLSRAPSAAQKPFSLPRHSLVSTRKTSAWTSCCCRFWVPLLTFGLRSSYSSIQVRELLRKIKCTLKPNQIFKLGRRRSSHFTNDCLSSQEIAKSALIPNKVGKV